VFGFIEPFYEAAPAEIQPGHVWCDQPIYLPPRHGLKINRVNPQDDRELEFRVSGRTEDTFQHAPVHSLKLQSSEAAVLAKTKKDRPVVVLGGTSATDLKARSAQHADVVMVLPIYGFDQFDERDRRRAAAYEFSNVFYLPAHDRPAFDEGFLRLDQVQPVTRNHLSRHRGLKLSDDSVDALVEWFIRYTTGRGHEDSLVLEYRREQLAALARES
jgi:hypothetical protein